MKGNKVILRRRKKSDEEDILRWLNMEEWQYMDDPSVRFEPISTDKFILKDDNRFFGNDIEKNSWHIENLDGEHIGFIKYFFDEGSPNVVEIGICIPNPLYWDKGYGKEAIMLLTDFLFEERKINVVSLVTWEGNKRAQALYKKLGFKKIESYNNIWDVVDKKYKESMLFSLSKKDFYNNKKILGK